MSDALRFERNQIPAARMSRAADMKPTNIGWAQGTWTTPPLASREESGRLVVEAVEGSDYWERTLYDFQHASGHALLAPWPESVAVEVSFALRGFRELYDQAGLMLWHSGNNWIKAGVEINDGVPHLGAVVTSGLSDWSLAPVPEWTDGVATLRASWSKGAVVIRASANGNPWRMLRVAPFPHPRGKQAGPFLCAPTRAGLEVTFMRWLHTNPDDDLHSDPPLPEAP
jgi:regulation of enolase protein 1 (concanavalin A-like superfamily)